MGRPLIEINWTEFDKLCGIQCTLREIAAWFECSEDTIERACVREKEMSFAELYSKKAGKGKISIRRKQYEVALGGNTTMLIWLGKQYLGQSEKQTISPESDPFINEEDGDLLAKAKAEK